MESKFTIDELITAAKTSQLCSGEWLDFLLEKVMNCKTNREFLLLETHFKAELEEVGNMMFWNFLKTLLKLL